MTSTRTRILETSAELFRLQGYNATGVKQIVTEAKAPFGSVYHHFPGGKEELAAAAVTISAGRYGELIPMVLDAAPDLPTGIRWFFAGAGEHLKETGYEDACPIATIALETASVSEPIREACHTAFEAWLAELQARAERAGLDATTSRQLALVMLSALEGAFVLARAARDTEPLIVTGELMAQQAERALSPS